MNPSRARRVFWLGLIVSVLLHLGLLSRDWVLPPVWEHTQESAPIEARLVLPPPPVKSVKPAPPPKPIKPIPKKENPPADVTPLPSAVDEDLPESTDLLSPPVVEVTENAPVAASEPEPAPIVAPAELAPPLNRLPRRITLEYRARYGLASGKQTLLWVNEGDHYTITSVIAAHGLASWVFSGQLVQTSRGRIVASGLQPEEFWDQRGNKRSQSRFDYDAHIILTDSNKGPRTAVLPANLQDAQSLLFQLALTAPPAVESESVVFNGKKARSYRYRVMGEEMLDTPLGPLRALRVMRLTDTDAERFEIWLAVDQYYLPVKLATEIAGYNAELMVQSIASE